MADKKCLVHIFASILIFTLIHTAYAVEVPIYIGEDSLEFPQNMIILDSDNSGGDVVIQFGATLGAFIKHNATSFQFNDDVDFMGNQLLNFRVENASSTPLCTSGTAGRIYYDTDDGCNYICDGTNWLKLGKNGLKAVQARAGVVAIPASYGDLNFATTDIETDDTVIEHHDTLRDRILIKTSGIYRIDYNISLSAPTSVGVANIDFRVRANDSTVLLGSQATSSSLNELLGSATRNHVSQSFIASLTAGDYLSLQAQSSLTISTTSDNVFVVRRLQ